ncbi:aminopeptidase PaaP [Virgisporangium ochraceum]|uniref:Aminopeptidase n=1 Tax=Virgisporangium ochraceum TaxID=65505 RepID=A0A8J4EBN2_9ACTN|nr:aminopeptidase [Virgisporangium ochraceum]
MLVGSFAAASPASAGKKPPKPPPGNSTPEKLTKAVTLPGLLRHLAAFQFIGDTNGDNRGSGGPGYDRSADYVAWTMKLAGYKVTRQPFDFTFCEETGPSAFDKTAPAPTATYVEGTDYQTTSCTGSGNATAAVVPVDINLTPPRASTSGCEATDFAGVDVAGKIALVQRGSCDFVVKVRNAEAAGAAGVVIFNQGNGTPEANPDRYALFGGNLGAAVGIPAVTVSYALGEQFATTAGLVLHIQTQAISETRSTENVIAESPGGNPDNVVMAGAHLDSEPDTVGINDNGSGSAALLEVAYQMRKVKPTNKVRFAWWGAEEAGLVGSNTYVAGLTEAQAAQIKLYLNFDMIASANYTLGVYDGDDSAGAGSGPGPTGSAEIEALFQKFFADRGLPTRASDFTGRSDYGAFIANGIPAGGLFTGAEEPKTADDVAKWGGLEGEQMDPCYHDPCDSFTPVKDGADAEVYRKLDRQYPLLGNINLRAFDVNADAIATAVITYAFDTSSIPPRVAAAAARSAGPASVASSVAAGKA